jgi:hypothetical protein
LIPGSEFLYPQYIVFTSADLLTTGLQLGNLIFTVARSL